MAMEREESGNGFRHGRSLAGLAAAPGARCQPHPPEPRATGETRSSDSRGRAPMTRSRSCRVVAVLAVALLAVGCDWAQFGADAGRSGFNPGESSLGPSIVPTLVRRWAQPVGTSNLSDP